MNPHVSTATRQHQTTKDRCRIVQLGLELRDSLVIESLFRTQPELATQFVFGEADGSDLPDMVFVNGDSADALAGWERLHHENPAAVPIMVTAGAGDFGACSVLRKPLSIRNFQGILDAITSTHPSAVTGEATDIGTLRVLVVDDSFPARQFMKLKLEELSGPKLRVLVDFADSGEKAVSCVSAQAYDLVFMDVVMPGMDGYQACALIKSVRPVRVAMLSSRSAPVDFTRGHEAGCDTYLPKPPNDVDLRSVLRLTALKKMTATP